MLTIRELGRVVLVLAGLLALGACAVPRSISSPDTPPAVFYAHNDQCSRFATGRQDIYVRCMLSRCHDVQLPDGQVIRSQCLARRVPLPEPPSPPTYDPPDPPDPPSPPVRPPEPTPPQSDSTPRGLSEEQKQQLVKDIVVSCLSVVAQNWKQGVAVIAGRCVAMAAGHGLVYAVKAYVCHNPDVLNVVEQYIEGARTYVLQNWCRA